MEILKLWYFICVVFGFHSLDTLVEESYEVVYEKSDKTDPVHYLICEELRSFNGEKSEIDLGKLRAGLYRPFNSSIRIYWEKSRRDKFEALILNYTKSGDYLIIDRLFCLIVNDKTDLGKIVLFFSYKTLFFAFKRDTFDFVKMRDGRDMIDQLIVLRRKHPYSDCSKSNARFHCLNGCLKKRFRLARYFYNSHETGFIHLNSSNRNASIKNHERNCLGECKRENCKVVQLISVRNFQNFQTQLFEGQLKLSEFDFWIQLIGLVGSFAGLSVHQLAFIAIEFTILKVKRRKVRIGLFYLKWATLLIILASFGYMCAQKCLDYKAEKNNPTMKQITSNSKLKEIRLMVCSAIENFVSDDYENKTMSQIERATDKISNDVLEGVYLTYQNKLFSENFVIESKVVFRVTSRCFLMSIHPKYQLIPSEPKLTVKFKNYIHYDLYLLSENENLNHKSLILHFGYYYTIRKRRVKRLKSGRKCVHYEKKYVNCTERRNCVERCVSRKIQAKYNAILFGIIYAGTDYTLIVDKDWFSSAEWNTSRPMNDVFENHREYTPIFEDCLKQIPNEKPCIETEFEKAEKFKLPNSETLEIDLQVNVLKSFEESPSSFKLALDIISIQSIFFGLTVLGILQMIYSFIKTSLKPKENRVTLFFIYFFCSIGCCLNSYFIFVLIINKDLSPTQYYKMAEMPEIIFCLRYDTSLADRNHKLTGNYLEELTSGLTAEQVFKDGTYLKSFNEWITFNISLMETFFLRKMKCFRIKIDRDCHRNRLSFFTESQVLKLNLTTKLQDEIWRRLYFMTESKETEELSKIVRIEYKWNSRFRSWKPKTSITHETSLYKYEDRFSFIKKHFPSFQEDNADLHEQLFELKSNKHNVKALNIPLEKEDFGLELDEDLFEQIFLIRNQKRNKQAKWNYEKVLVDNQFRNNFFASDSESDFIFNLIFLKKIVFLTNEENFGMLILSLLNVLSLWFDLGVLDLHPFFPLFHDHVLVYLYLHLPVFLFHKITQFLIFSSNWLKKFKLPLYKRLKSSADDVEDVCKEREEEGVSE